MYLITSVLALIGTGQYNKFVIGKGEWWRHDPVVVCTSYFESEGRWFQARLFSVFSCCFLRQLRNCIHIVSLILPETTLRLRYGRVGHLGSKCAFSFTYGRMNPVFNPTNRICQRLMGVSAQRLRETKSISTLPGWKSKSLPGEHSSIC